MRKYSIYFDKYTLAQRKIQYRIHQMVSRIFCNYESTNFSRNWDCLSILMHFNVNNNIHFCRKKIVNSWLQNSWNYRMNSIQVCVDRFVNMFLTIRFGKHILFRDPSELKFHFVHQNEIAALSSGQKLALTFGCDYCKSSPVDFSLFNRNWA